jgi:hypothetical protein
LATDLQSGRMQKYIYLFDKKKVVLFLSDMKFCFFKGLASAIEEGTTSFVPGIHVIGDQMPKQTDREADYMCFSPLQRKTSKLKGEEEYTSRLVSGIT